MSWVLIDFVVPPTDPGTFNDWAYGVGFGNYSFSAFMTVPETQEEIDMIPTTTGPVDGVVSEWGFNGFILRIASAGLPFDVADVPGDVPIVADHNVTFSILVDLFAYSPGQLIEFDIYGYLPNHLVTLPQPVQVHVQSGAGDTPYDMVSYRHNAMTGSPPWQLNSVRWEQSLIYPDRPLAPSIGEFTFPTIDGDPTLHHLPYYHFGGVKIGTISILLSDTPDGPPQEITFGPDLPPPTDGTPDGDGAIGDGTAPGRTANPQLRAWTFSLDGHDFYVLRLGDFDQLVYDTYSEQWMDWNDFDSLTWRAHCGRNWIGAEALGDTYGSNVIAGDDTHGLLWFLDPEQPHDDDPLGTDTPSYFARVTVGQVTMKGRESLSCYATWLTANMGDPAYSGAAVTLWTSDDAGDTWDNQGYISVTAGEAKPELSWYSLGQIEAPGRLFKIFDDGAITRIDALEMNDPDDQK